MSHPRGDVGIAPYAENARCFFVGPDVAINLMTFSGGEDIYLLPIFEFPLDKPLWLCYCTNALIQQYKEARIR